MGAKLQSSNKMSMQKILDKKSFCWTHTLPMCEVLLCVLWTASAWDEHLCIKLEDSSTYKKAHEIEGEDGGHPSEGQSLKHSTADARAVAVILGAAVVAAGRPAGGPCRAQGDDHKGKHLYCFIVLPAEEGKELG